MSFLQAYKSKVVSPEKALELINPGDGIVLSQGAATPDLMIKTLAKNKERFNNTKVFNVLNMNDMALAHEDMQEHFQCSTIFATATNRGDINAGRAEYLPAHFHMVPSLLGEEIPCDVAILAMTPPNKDGFCSLSLGVDYAVKAAKCARVVIAECNDRLPFTYGGGLIHIDDITAVVESSYDPPQNPPSKIGEKELAIGSFCASLINDGDTLQLGIGALPDAVLLSLKDKKDLGIHSEMFSDGVVELIEEGVVNNRKKELHVGKSVATFLMGSKRLYDYVNDNLDVEMYPVDYVNDPKVIMGFDNIVSINSAIQVDLTGQVCAETIGLKHYSGTGGQGDFIRGAAMSKNGRSILTLLSTTKNDTISRIVPVLDEGAGVTTPRTDVHYIVTEYGIAKLRGKTMSQRARALIEVAHPNFRAELIEAFEKRFNMKY